VFYGPGPTDESAIARIQCPVHGFYAGNDNRVTSTVAKSEEMMKKAGKTYETVTYEGAGHASCGPVKNPGDTNPANKKARDQAWKKWKDLLGKL